MITNYDNNNNQSSPISPPSVDLNPFKTQWHLPDSLNKTNDKLDSFIHSILKHLQEMLRSRVRQNTSSKKVPNEEISHGITFVYEDARKTLGTCRETVSCSHVLNHLAKPLRHPASSIYNPLFVVPMTEFVLSSLQLDKQSVPSAGHTRYLPTYLLTYCNYLFVIHRPPTHGATDPSAINPSADSVDWFVGHTSGTLRCWYVLMRE